MLRLRIILQCNKIYYGLLIIAVLFALYRINLIKYNSNIDITSNYYKGIVLSIKHSDNKYVLTVKGKEKVLIYIYTDKTIKFKIGSLIELNGTFTKPLNNTIPNTFNYFKYLKNHQIYYIMVVDNYKILKGSNNVVYQFKNYLINKINSYKNSKGYLNLFILGDKSEITDIYKIYQNNGISHLLAISAMHINFIALTLLLLLKKVRGKYLIVIAILIGYALIIGQSASLLRSLIFFILYTINKKFSLEIEVKNILFLTVVMLIFSNSLVVYDIGFQYSTIITYGLIICRKYYRKSYLYNLLLTSIVAALFSLPITLLNNYEFNILSIFNNILFVPYITFIVFPLSIIVLFLPFLEPILNIMISILESLNIYLNISLFKIIIPKVSILFYAIYYVLLITSIYSNSIKLLLINLLLVLSLKIKPLIDSKIYVYFLDVGQGDSILIHSNKENILIDTGGQYNFDVSNNTITFMKSLGINKLDLLLITHGDSDHVKDAVNIINNFKVKKVLLNNNSANQLEKQIINTKVRIVNKYQSKFDYKIYNKYIGSDENRSSIISLLKINKYKLLFMGDAPKEEEKLFLIDYNSTADILKLGHHGSKTSSDYNFLKKLKIKEAIISAGRNNIFGHPNKETIVNLKKLNIVYYSTQDYGTIAYIFRRYNYTIKTYPP